MDPARETLTAATEATGRRYTGALMVLAAASLWGTLGYFGRRLYPLGITPLELASVRAAIGFLGLALWAARAPARLRIRPRDLPFFALYGVVAVALFQWFYFATIERTTLANAAALLYTAPAFVVLGSALLANGDVPGAENALREALRINPFDPQPHCDLARATRDAVERTREETACRTLRAP